MNIEAQELLDLKETLGLRATVGALIRLSTKVNPVEYVPYLSEDLIEQMMYSVAMPEDSAERVGLIESLAFSEDCSQSEIKQAYELRKMVYFASDWRMHSFFLRFDKTGKFEEIVKEKEEKYKKEKA